MYKVRAGAPRIGDLEKELVLRALDRGQVSAGAMVREFEEMFAKWLEADYALTTPSGTTALHLALAALGIGPGDEVITTPLTFVATANAIAYTGATPVFVDVDPLTWTISTDEVEAAITPRTRAILPVHLYGVPADMTAIVDIADQRGLYVVEDAAEGLGALHRNRKVGLFGDFACFSFYANKTITTGEGGMVVTADGHFAQRANHLRGQAQTRLRYWHDALGFNYRMSEVQGALGCAQMLQINEFVASRQWVIDKYRERLGQMPGVRMQQVARHDVHGGWAMAITVPNQKAVMAALENNDIDCRPVFPLVSQMSHHIRMDARPTPVAAHISCHGVVLPTHQDLSEADIELVCDVVKGAVNA
jgi:perosamine synthetase